MSHKLFEKSLLAQIVSSVPELQGKPDDVPPGPIEASNAGDRASPIPPGSRAP